MSSPSLDRAVIVDSWRQLREAGRLGTLLPQCIDRSWGSGPDAYGFVTLDYRVYQDFPIRPAESDPAMGRADLLEMYWSVRTRGGQQDPNWAAALNAHVVQIEADPVAVEHLDRLYRLVVTLRRALQLGAIGPIVSAGKSAALHVRGLLLGRELSTPTGIVERLAGHADVPLTVGQFSVEESNGPVFASPPPSQRQWEDGDVSEELLESLGRRLTQNDVLYRTQGIWQPDPGYDWDDEGNLRPSRK